MILFQFERLFKLLLFKIAYRSHKFLCLVDNAKNHTKAEINVHNFGMKVGTRCPVDYIDFIDDMNHRRIIECYSDDGTSKGLLAITRELTLAMPNKCSLSELKAVLWMHNAFKLVGKVKVKVLPEPLRLIGPNTVRACQDSAASAHRRVMWPAPCPTALTFPGPKRTRYPFTAGLTGERPTFWFLPLPRIELEPLV